MLNVRVIQFTWTSNHWVPELVSSVDFPFEQSIDCRYSDLKTQHCSFSWGVSSVNWEPRSEPTSVINEWRTLGLEHTEWPHRQKRMGLRPCSAGAGWRYAGWANLGCIVVKYFISLEKFGFWRDIWGKPYDCWFVSPAKVSWAIPPVWLAISPSRSFLTMDGFARGSYRFCNLDRDCSCLVNMFRKYGMKETIAANSTLYRYILYSPYILDAARNRH